VDDVLILTKADIHEWLEIEKIIAFCKASGLQVNNAKTTMHFAGLSESDLSPLNYFFLILCGSFLWFKIFGLLHKDWCTEGCGLELDSS
jgi:hypothetical protein